MTGISAQLYYRPSWLTVPEEVTGPVTNLIQNPSVELGLGAFPTIWDNTTTATLNNFSASGSWASHGSQSAHYKATSTGADKDARLTYYFVPGITAGESYSLGLDLNLVSKGQVPLSLFILWFDGAYGITDVSTVAYIESLGRNLLATSTGFRVFDGGGSVVVLDPSVETALTGWQASCTGTLNDFSRSTSWSSGGTHSIHYKGTASADGDHADLGFQWGGERVRTDGGGIVPGETYTFKIDVNILSKPSHGQAAFIVWLDGASAPIFPEIRGGMALSTGVHTLTVESVAPDNAVFAWCFVANGGGGAGGLFNELRAGEVSEYYADNPQLYAGGMVEQNEQRVVLENVIAPATTANAQIFVGQNADLQNGEVVEFYADGLQLEVGGTASSYFDGDSPGCEWNGARHVSTSLKPPHGI